MSRPVNKTIFRARGSRAYLSGAKVFACLALLTTLFLPAISHAQGFAAIISPPRFEVAVQPGKTTRQIIEITHAANRSGSYRVYTNDWSLGSDGSAVFSDELVPNSCRPWVSLERRDLTLPASGKIRFRFEISPPADAAVDECRFAIMIEGLEQVIKTEGAVSFPVSGRVCVIVYAAVGAAKPKLEITHAGTGLNEGTVVPQLQVRNTGNAHGRLGGFLTGLDAQGRQIDFAPEALPILPGKLRIIPLIPNAPGDGTVKMTYPLTVKGNIEWGDQKMAIDLRYETPVAESTPSSIVPPTKKVSPLVPPPAAK